MNKYDRQIRLWSKIGQDALQNARILVIGLNTASIEAVKCVALAGLGHVTLFDTRNVDEADVVSNFFVDSDDISKPIALAAQRLLAELNPDIEIVGTVNEPDWQGFDLICVANAPKERVVQLWSSTNVPIVTVTDFGFYSTVGSFYRQFTSFQTHPLSLVDLRFGKDNVWPEYQEYIESLDFDAMDDYQRGNVPYCAILAKFADSLGLPSTSSEKASLRDAIKKQARPNDENWSEALKQAFKVWSPIVPSNLQSIFKQVDPNLDHHPTEFWLMAAALREFHNELKTLPVSGVLPDMKTDTQSYVRIQNIYKEKALADYQRFTAFLEPLCEKYHLPLPDEEVRKTFCRNCRHLIVINGKSPEDYYLKNIQESQGDPERAPFLDIYYALEFASRTQQSGDRYWSNDEQTKQEFEKKMAQAHLEADVSEIVRSSGGELNSIASIAGAMAAQEITKQVLKQYIPLQHMVVYDGINSSSCTF